MSQFSQLMHDVEAMEVAKHALASLFVTDDGEDKSGCDESSTYLWLRSPRVESS